MTMRAVAVPLALLLALLGSAHAGTPAWKEIVLTNQPEPYVVPEGRIWKIEGLSPYESERGIGTADIYLEGQVFIGKDKDYSLYGTFDLSINVTQRFPVWIPAGSKIRIGDSRGRLVVKECVDK